MAITTPSASAPSRERAYPAMGGAPVLIAIIFYFVALLAVIFGLRSPEPALIIVALVSVPLFILALRGFFVVQPNSAKVMVLLGTYKGTVRKTGFFWANPFTIRNSISLRANNIASNVIKVNDLDGNPIEIGGVVVWRVNDTAQARFDVEDFRDYVDVQIETAVRQLASTHPYDDMEGTSTVPTLRGDSAVLSEKLREQLSERLDRAGIDVIEARISHLAYAPEIAAAMLQRQQASAIIAARQKIVEGAVLMVEDALNQLQKKDVVTLDHERKATLVGNLLVVLCGQENAQPIINTGTLYS